MQENGADRVMPPVGPFLQAFQKHVANSVETEKKKERERGVRYVA